MFFRKRLHRCFSGTGRALIRQQKRPPTQHLFPCTPGVTAVCIDGLFYFIFLFLFIVSVKEIVSHAILLVSDDGIQVDILHASENIIFNDRILLGKFMDQFLDLRTLGALLSTAAGCTVLCKAACTLDEMKVIVIRPVNDICLTDQIQRADQLHSLKVRTVKLRHHGLDLCAIEHSHQDRLDDIIIVMSQRDLVAAQFFGFAVEITSSHSRAEIAW